MVKKRGRVWNHWTIICKLKTHPSVKCNYCSKYYAQGFPKRMQGHLDKECQEAPNNAKSQPTNVEPQNTQTSTFDFIVEQQGITLTETEVLESNSSEIPSSYYIPLDGFEAAETNMLAEYC